jgi:hypothetical protein
MLKDIRKDAIKLIVAFRKFCEKRLETLVIGYVSNKNMLQFETCKKISDKCNVVETCRLYNYGHRDRHTTRQIINLLKPTGQVMHQQV